MDRKKKELDFLRGMEELNSTPIKSPDYTSPLDQEVMRVKGGTEHINTQEPIGRVSGSAPIDTKGAQPLQSGDAWKRKIEGLRNARKAALGSLKSLPMVGTIVGVGSALLGSGDVSASERASAVADELTNNAPIVGNISPTVSGPDKNSLEYKLETGTITPEELALLRQQFGM